MPPQWLATIPLQYCPNAIPLQFRTNEGMALGRHGIAVRWHGIAVRWHGMALGQHGIAVHGMS
jgi:hypothetical protein